MAIASPPALGVIIQEWILVAAALVFVILRLWVRGWLQGRLALSDLFVILAFLMNVISNVNDYLAWKYGLWNPNLTFGGSAPPLDLERYIPDRATQVKALKNLYVSSIPYYLLMYFVKGSFLLFYLKLFPKSFPALRKGLWFAIVFTMVGLVVSMLSNIFWCWPISRNWSLDPSQQCLSATSDGPYFITVAFHVISDLQIYSLPFFLLRHLDLSHRKVVGLALIFSLGGICIAFTVARTAVVGDSVTLVLLASLGSAEITSAIIVACCPPLKWLYHSWLYRPGGGRQVSTLWRRGRKRTTMTTTSARSRSGKWAVGGRTRTRTGKTSRATSNTDVERERRRWTFTVSAMDPDDGYDIMNDSEIEGTTIASRSRRSEIEMEGGGTRTGQSHDRHEYESEEEGEDEEEERLDSPTVPTRPPVAGDGSEIVVVVSQRIMDQGTIDNIGEDPDRIGRCKRQDSVTVGNFDDLQRSVRPQNL